MDDADRAEEQIEAEMAYQLARQRANNPIGLGLSHCAECGEAIPVGRQSLGYRKCIDCTEADELRGRWR